MIRGIEYIRLHSGTTCPWPTRAREGVLRCIIRAERCTEHRHLPKPLVRAADYLWAVKPWWPNSLGERLDRFGRGQAGLPQDNSLLHALLVKFIDKVAGAGRSTI